MKYDFDKKINRKDTNSLKWDLYDDVLPMWVADMDFEVADEITDAIKSRAEHKIYAYTIVGNKWADSYHNWWKKRHDIVLDKDKLLFSTGVMPSITSIIREFSDEGDSILIQTPVYHTFFYVIEANNRKVVENELKYENHTYSIDFKDLEEKLKSVKMMLLCNPHNPIGKIWTRDELEKIVMLCNRYGVLLVSDEIHCDLVNPGSAYVPIFSLDSSLTSNVIMCMSPTKTFNLAGIQSSAVYSPNMDLITRIKNRLMVDFYSMPNVFAVEAAIAAFEHGQKWLDEVNEYIYQNKLLVKAFIEEKIPSLTYVDSEATYLLWLDGSKAGVCEEFCENLKNNYSLYVSGGKQFGNCGSNFIRLNIACPKAVLEEALHILKKAITDNSNI